MNKIVRQPVTDRIVNFQSVSVKESQAQKIIDMKDRGEIDSVSYFIRELIDEYFKQKGRMITKDLVLFVIYPLAISAIFFIWSANQAILVGPTNLNILYIFNIISAAIALAGISQLMIKIRGKNKRR